MKAGGQTGGSGPTSPIGGPPRGETTSGSQPPVQIDPGSATPPIADEYVRPEMHTLTETETEFLERPRHNIGYFVRGTVENILWWVGRFFEWAGRRIHMARRPRRYVIDSVPVEQRNPPQLPMSVGPVSPEPEGVKDQARPPNNGDGSQENPYTLTQLRRYGFYGFDVLGPYVSALGKLESRFGLPIYSTSPFAGPIRDEFVGASGMSVKPGSASERALAETVDVFMLAQSHAPENLHEAFRRFVGDPFNYSVLRPEATQDLIHSYMYIYTFGHEPLDIKDRVLKVVRVLREGTPDRRTLFVLGFIAKMLISPKSAGLGRSVIRMTRWSCDGELYKIDPFNLIYQAAVFFDPSWAGYLTRKYDDIIASVDSESIIAARHGSITTLLNDGEEGLGWEFDVILQNRIQPYTRSATDADVLLHSVTLLSVAGKLTDADRQDVARLLGEIKNQLKEVHNIELLKKALPKVKNMLERGLITGEYEYERYEREAAMLEQGVIMHNMQTVDIVWHEIETGIAATLRPVIADLRRRISAGDTSSWMQGPELRLPHGTAGGAARRQHEGVERARHGRGARARGRGAGRRAAGVMARGGAVFAGARAARHIS